MLMGFSRLWNSKYSSSAMMSSVTADTSGMPMYTMRASSMRLGRSGGGVCACSTHTAALLCTQCAQIRRQRSGLPITSTAARLGVQQQAVRHSDVRAYRSHPPLQDPICNEEHCSRSICRCVLPHIEHRSSSHVPLHIVGRVASLLLQVVFLSLLMLQLVHVLHAAEMALLLLATTPLITATHMVKHRCP